MTVKGGNSRKIAEKCAPECKCRFEQRFGIDFYFGFSVSPSYRFTRIGKLIFRQDYVLVKFSKVSNQIITINTLTRSSIIEG